MFKEQRVKIFKDLIKALLVTFLVASIALWFFWDQEKRLRKTGEREVALTGQFLSGQFQLTMERNINVLENLKSRIEVTDGEYFRYWVYDAGLIVDHNSSFRFVEWIDSNMIIQRVQPVEGNEKVIGLDISRVEYRRNDWLKSKTDSLTNITHWAKLTQGGSVFLVDAPVYYQDAFQGTITAGIDFQESFDEVMAGRGNYNLALYDHLGNQFYQYGNNYESEGSDDYVFTKSIPVNKARKQFWKFELWPEESFFEDSGIAENRLRLVLNLILALLMGGGIYFMIRSARYARRVRSINKRLKSVNYKYEREHQKALKASRIKSEFLSNMSHEIRTPLNAVLALIDIMQQQNVSEEQARYLQMMEYSSKNLLLLINDILEIDKMESGKVKMTRESFVPIEELKELIALYQSTFEAKDLYLRLNLDQNRFYAVKGDKIKLIQIITNLLRNASKFTMEGGVKVYYKEEKVGETVNIKLTVEDTGIGIPENKIKTVFERFSQLDSGYQKKYEGSGLGLAITSQIVEMMNGHISLESKVGEGSTFKVELNFPLDKDAPDGVRKVINTAPADFKEKTVLIAEDNPLNVLVLSKVLEQLNVSSEVAQNGLEVLEKVEQKGYDLIFMDIHMPEMDGLEATKELNNRGVKIPVVAISANVLKETMDKAKALGINDYVTKPFSRDVLIKVLNKYLS